MKVLTTVLIVLGLMLPSFGRAEGGFIVSGIAAMPCGEWIEVREDKKEYGSLGINYWFTYTVLYSINMLMLKKHEMQGKEEAPPSVGKDNYI